MQFSVVNIGNVVDVLSKWNRFKFKFTFYYYRQKVFCACQEQKYLICEVFEGLIFRQILYVHTIANKI